MKKLYTLLTAVILTASVMAQAPEKMSYQAVVRDVSNTLVTNQAVGMQISILQGSVSGTAVYVEKQTPTTNINGLVSIEIGSGTVVSGAFNTIVWSNGPYFIKTETDPTGGTTFTITGTSQLMSVPYAFHANTADSIIGGVSVTETDPVFGTSIATGITALDTAYWNNHTDDTDTQLDSTDIINLGFVAGLHTVNTDTFYLGQDTLGGIVYYIYKDASGNQHGLIVNKHESLSMTQEQWQSSSSSVGADRTDDGIYNTNLMINSTAVTYIANYGAGWYLPSIDELNLLWQSRFNTNKALRADGVAVLLSTYSTYWSSTEHGPTNAFKFSFRFGSSSSSDKTETHTVRAIRSF